MPHYRSRPVRSHRPAFRRTLGVVPNRLASATSPYLLQHADNPVDWVEWGDEAFAEAVERGTCRCWSRSATPRATGAT